LPSNFILLSNFRWPSWIAFWTLILKTLHSLMDENSCHETHSISFLSLHQAEAWNAHLATWFGLLSRGTQKAYLP
jgi:hypothetical protein